MRNWMKYNLVITLLLLSGAVQAEYNPDSYAYVMVGAGKNLGHRQWNDHNTMGNTIGAGYRHRLGDTQFFGGVRWEHTSQLLVGAPFDDQAEGYLDHVGITLEYRI